MGKDKILIVEDEPKICSILSVLLTKNGYEVEVANSGEAGGSKGSHKFAPRCLIIFLFFQKKSQRVLTKGGFVL